MPAVGAFTVPGILLPADTTSNRPVATDVVPGTLFPSTDDEIIYQSDGATWTAWATFTSGGLNDQGEFTYLDAVEASAPGTPASGRLRLYAKTGSVLAVKDDAGAETVLGQGIADQGAFTFFDGTEASAPSTPASGFARLYVKTDGRFYSKDDAGTEFGPFDAAGGGGTLYAIDETFPGSSLPAGWAFTGSGSATVSGGKVALSFTAQSDRLMFAHSMGTGNHILRCNLKNYTGTHGGMVGLSVLDASGLGVGMSPYSDATTYFWKAATTGYQYSATNTVFGSTPSLTDIWWEMMVTGGKVVGGGYSTDGGATWTAQAVTSPVAYTPTQVGICRLLTANETMDLYELTCTEP